MSEAPGFRLGNAQQHGTRGVDQKIFTIVAGAFIGGSQLDHAYRPVRSRTNGESSFMRIKQPAGNAGLQECGE